MNTVPRNSAVKVLLKGLIFRLTVYRNQSNTTWTVNNNAQLRDLITNVMEGIALEPIV